MNSPVSILLAVASIGGQLGIAGDKLRMLLPPDCAPDLKAAIRQYKPALIELLRLNFLVVQSAAVNATLLWCPDAQTKAALISAGADAGSTYASDELRALVNRRITTAELAVIHEAKRQFLGRIKP